ncbi:hypothetical protein GCM10007913_07710 [Devosia yakushimensis]|uniref:Leucyl/phenylalanyl-tRNA--protein transferase n=1 Tax=Devosia yakushimensis TaxID=470028 RepID=A0ABQ5U9N3_9HYPH|nr:leucyl/phenylalanyl-tRNA--protein transferase [Devosia yakushimensis]GLQ08839.1 hypothetical protein GCM10007913_07710 [Devosia yakushimensis]
MTEQSQFSESLPVWVRRQALGLALRLMPKRLVDSAYLTAHTAYRLVVRGPRVPNASSIVSRPNDYGGPVYDTSSAGLLAGMQNGFYFLCHIAPLKWWSPPMRGVMMISGVHVAKRFKRSLKSSPFTVTIDKDFAGVLRGCAAIRPGRPPLTWLFPATQRRLQKLYEEGHAHSVEVWNEQGELVGGVFGVMLGTVFTALSMFHTEDNASKVAIVSLYHHLDAWGVDVVDHQGLTPWVETLGGVLVTREQYVALLARPAKSDAAKPGPWHVQFSPAQTGEWEPSQPAPAKSEAA